MAIYLEEFLYRGRPPGATEPPAYHVVLGDQSTDAFGRPVIATSGALTPEQAATAGFPLPVLVSAINAEVMAENAALQVQVADLRAQVAQLTPVLAGGPAESDPAPGP